MYYEGAFDAASISVIESRVPPEQRIAVSERDALHFACNAVSAGPEVLLNFATPELRARLEAAGYSVHETPTPRVHKIRRRGQMPCAAAGAA